MCFYIGVGFLVLKPVHREQSEKGVLVNCMNIELFITGGTFVMFPKYKEEKRNSQAYQNKIIRNINNGETGVVWHCVKGKLQDIHTMSVS